MGGFKLEWDLSDFDRIATALTNFNPTDVGRNIGERLRTEALLRFDKGESPKGEKWPPSKRATAKGGQTLVDTAALRNSITYQVNPEGIQLGPGPLPYAAIHQFGGMAGRGRQVEIPRRQYIPEPEDFTAADLERMGEMIVRALVDQIGRA